jgi:hypothetical protein
MNTANLQLEGLYLAVAAITESLVAKGALTRDDVAAALDRAEQAALRDDRFKDQLSPAQHDAIAFPARLLRLANQAGANGETPTFSSLARKVGQTKDQ